MKRKMKSKKLVIGILAHVDAGKTTLAESMLFHSGEIKRQGRVDHKDAFLDTYELEKSRGITIFSKQAELKFGNRNIALLDTPGHVDFSTEMERTLRVLDYAVLVISGADGVQSHVQTLWQLLDTYQIPTFIFVNKMDQKGTEETQILSDLHKRLDEKCIPFINEGDEKNDEKKNSMYEQIAMVDDAWLDIFLDKGEIADKDIKILIKERKIFPVYFGSALKNQGVDALIQGMEYYAELKDYPEDFGAKVFKITRDEQGNRLTHMKITGGTLNVKTLLSHKQGNWSEKVDQIRIYSGAGFQGSQEAIAGEICAVTGLTQTVSGEGIGIEEDWHLPVLEPVLTYQLRFLDEVNVYDMYSKLSQLQEEDPSLHIIWDKEANEIQVQVMGEIQIEILKNIVQQRFHTRIEFGSESIVYKETVAEAIIGIGHFEPLKHYAEAHILIEPGERGSGIQICSDVSEDALSKNWQHLVLLHLGEKNHKGVMVGADVTDVKFTLVAGRGHLKHTEGGDFREATYRAVRHGLMQAKTVLLEPVYEYRLEIPTEFTGRGMTDIQKMFGTFQPPELEGDMTIIVGTAPVATMRGYQQEVISYTKGYGRLFCFWKGYDVCHNQEEVAEAMGYDPVGDLENPPGSIFCSHGAGYHVPWEEVHGKAHIEQSYLEKTQMYSAIETMVERETVFEDRWFDPEELEAIFQRTYGTVKREKQGYYKKKKTSAGLGAGNYASNLQNGLDAKGERIRNKPKVRKDEYLLVDGYNIIFDWQDLNELANKNIDGARGKLLDILSNYQGYRKMNLIVVFDAYKVKGNTGSIQKYHNIDVVYTKEAETADAYIEKTVHKMGRNFDVTVATSDALEQMIIMGQGAMRLSASGLLKEIIEVNQMMKEEH